MKTKNRIWFCTLLGLGLFFTTNCKKDEDSTSAASVTDADGNIYSTVSIGKQVWMKENLKTTKYNDGTPIPNITDYTAWEALSTPSYCWYNNDAASYKAYYGALYNWYAVNTGKLCPTGWHVPIDIEWTILTTYLGGNGVAGGKLKETSTIYWWSPNTGATNETGFTALPGGERNYDGSYLDVGSYGRWWSSTADMANSAYLRYVFWYTALVYREAYLKSYGFSVRCLKDN